MNDRTIWKPMKGFEGRYEVGLNPRTGRLRSVRGAGRRVLWATALGCWYQIMHGYVGPHDDGFYHLKDAAGKIHLMTPKDVEEAAA